MEERNKILEILEDGIEKAREKRKEEERKECIKREAEYNIPIDVDTIEKGYPKLCA